VKRPRRIFLELAAAALVLPVVSRIAGAQTYPTRPVRLIDGFPAGNASDILARLMGESLSQQLGQRFIIENRPGAGSNLGAEVVVRAPSDGYTLLLITPSNAINATLYKRLPFDFIHDTAPVASMVRAPYVMVVNPSVPANTVPEFIAYARANPGKLNMASAGIGGATHVFGEMFMMMAGVNLLHVPYRGSFIPDLLGGQVQVLFAPIAHVIEHIRAGKLRALAVTSATRSDALPGIPTVAEFVSGYESSGWYGIAAPRNTSTEIIDRLNKEVNAALADAKMKTRLEELGVVPMPMTPSEFGEFIAAETEKWGKVVRVADIKVE
jgi:tripartite-type tricarboxylate transporter receptor subunit TctC